MLCTVCTDACELPPAAASLRHHMGVEIVGIF